MAPAQPEVPALRWRLGVALAAGSLAVLALVALFASVRVGASAGAAAACRQVPPQQSPPIGPPPGTPPEHVTKPVVPPPSPPCLPETQPIPPPDVCVQVSGSGTLVDYPGVRFTVDVRYQSLKESFAGKLTLDDPANAFSFVATDFTFVYAFEETVFVQGFGTGNGEPMFFYLWVTDGVPDRFTLYLGNGYWYDSELETGRIDVRHRC